MPSARPWQSFPRLVSPDPVFRQASTDGVWLLGDSITYQTAAEVGGALNRAGLVLAVDAQPGIPVTPTVDRLTTHLRRGGPPRALVMAVGTNDVARAGEPPSVLPVQMARALGLVPRSTRVIWVNVYKDQHPTSSPAMLALTERANRSLATQAARFANASVVDWFSAVAPTPEVFLRDGVHTTPEGAHLRAALLVRAVTAVPAASAVADRTRPSAG